jgi:hypothetical protein
LKVRIGKDASRTVPDYGGEPGDASQADEGQHLRIFAAGMPPFDDARNHLAEVALELIPGVALTVSARKPGADVEGIRGLTARPT